MKKILFLLLILGCAGGEKFKQEKNTFYSDSIKDGERFITTFQWTLIKVDTINNHGSKVYKFYYK